MLLKPTPDAPATVPLALDQAELVPRLIVLSGVAP